MNEDAIAPRERARALFSSSARCKFRLDVFAQATVRRRQSSLESLELGYAWIFTRTRDKNTFRYRQTHPR